MKRAHATEVEPQTAARLRQMITPDEALDLVVRTAIGRTPQGVPLVEACGLRLAEPIQADRDYPPFDRATMDGYAVRTVDAGKTVAVVGQIAAGQVADTAVASGLCLEIMTGAPCPPGTEAVVQKELVQRDGDRVILPSRIEPGGNIAQKGSECRAGGQVLAPGQTITPLAVAVMASVGLKSVRVVPRPRLAIITTGRELIPPGEDPGPASIRDSNGPMLAAMARDMQMDRPPHLHADDRLESIGQALEQAAERDMVLVTGGVSAGNYDLVPQALDAYGAEVVFHHVTQKPGKPLLLARKGMQLLFGLPGNPLSCHFCFHRYVMAAIRKMEGKPPLFDPLSGELTGPVAPKAKRTCFVPGRAERAEGRAADWRIEPLPGASSADVFASSGANCYVQVPPGDTMIPGGIVLPFTWIGSAPWPN